MVTKKKISRDIFENNFCGYLLNEQAQGQKALVLHEIFHDERDICYSGRNKFSK